MPRADGVRTRVHVRGHARVAVECGCGRTPALVAPEVMGVRTRALLAVAGGALTVCVGEMLYIGGLRLFYVCKPLYGKINSYGKVLITEVKGFC